MSGNGAIIRFNKVSFEYDHNKPILDEADFSVRRGAKITLMGQNGAGKSTLFKLITGEFKPEDGVINIDPKATIAVSKQVIPRDQMELTVLEFFQKCFAEKVYDIDPKIDKVLDTVNLHAPKDRIIKSFSGGQQARLLLASAIIQNPDILLLDEPTNNLDKEGVAHLTKFIKDYQKTCIVISHDADFLNSFSDGVLYLNLHTLKVELYVGNYFDVVKQITAQIQKENRKNSQFDKKIQDNKDKANFFAMKGGRMRLLAKRMREEAAEMEEDKVDVRREDKTIRPFTIPTQPNLIGEILNISSFSVLDLKSHKPVDKKAEVSLRKNRHLLLSGPNGIGKSTLLEAIADSKAEGSVIANNITVGYYRQDFSTLNFEDTVYEALLSVMEKHMEHELRSVAAGFLINKDIIHTKIGNLSEGQKGLVAFAQLVLLKPSLLILDEPTNHINFRHLPVIAKALDEYEGAMILVSHVPDFVEQIRVDETLDLGK